MLAGAALQNAYAIVNGVWVGQCLGEDALAAVTAGFPVIFVLTSAAMGLTMAANVLVSQAFGARDIDRVRLVVRNAVVLAMVIGILLLVIGHIATPSLLRAMNTPPQVFALSCGYLRVFLFTIPLSFGVFLIAAMLRGVGDSTTPLYFQGGAIIATGILDPILMFGWLGLPRLELMGTAYASILAQGVSLLALVVHVHRSGHIVAPDWRHLRADRRTTWMLLKVGVPIAVQQTLVSVCVGVVVSLVAQFGSAAVAAYGACLRIEQLALLPALTLGMAISTISGQNIGAGRYDRVREVFRWGLLLSGGITVVVMALALSAPGLLMRMFIGEPDVIRIGVGYLRIVALGYLCFATMFASNGVINGSGQTFMTTLFTVAALWAVRVPVAVCLSRSLGRVEGVWYGIVIGFAAGMIISLTYYMSGRWRRSIPVVRPARPATGIAEEQTAAE